MNLEVIDENKITAVGHFIVVAVFLLLSMTPQTFAQATEEVATETSTATTDEDTVLDEAPFISSRAAGLGGALSTLADDIDAVYYNPAGIGGLHWEKAKPPFLRKVYFPLVGAGANANTQNLIRDFRNEDGTRDTTVGRAIVNAHEGDRQYARVSAAFGTVFGRMIVAPFIDHQIAAVSYGPDAAGQESDLIKMRYRTMTGAMAGGSICDPSGTVYLGWSSVYASRKESMGDFSYLDMLTSSTRNSAINALSTTYTGVANNAGMLWRISEKGRPSLGVSLRNFGDTKYKSSSSDQEDLTIKQDMAVGFSLSPNINKWGTLNFIVEEDHVGDNNITLQKKHHIGLELLAYGPRTMGSYAMLGARTGYSNAGISFGLTLNVGLINLEAGSFAEDLGIDNKRVPERRTIYTVGINVAQF